MKESYYIDENGEFYKSETLYGVFYFLYKLNPGDYKSVHEFPGELKDIVSNLNRISFNNHKRYYIFLDNSNKLCSYNLDTKEKIYDFNIYFYCNHRDVTEEEYDILLDEGIIEFPSK